jgi:hypothetical protein
MCDQLKVSEIIKDRHEEASDVKHCFTDFAFKGLLLSTAFFGAIIKFYPTGEACTPYVLMWLFCGAVILVMMRIVEIGIHKYSTANRNYGYVLHLARTYDYEKHTSPDTEKKTRGVGWEAAMFAWRVIQPILSDEIYKQRTWLERSWFAFGPLERKKHRRQSYHWWNTKDLMNSKEASSQNNELGFSYHPGSYLQKAQRLIHILCGVIFVIFAFSYLKEMRCMYNATSSLAQTLASFSGSETVLQWTKNSLPDLRATPEKIVTWQNWKFLMSYFLLLGYFSFLILRGAMRQRARRIILEEGLLSIQSCAVVWRLVVFSHLKALEQGEKEGKGYKGYTRRLVENACVIKDDLLNIHDKLMKNDWPPTGNQNNESTATNKSKETKLNSEKNVNETVFNQPIVAIGPYQQSTGDVSPVKNDLTKSADDVS